MSSERKNTGLRVALASYDVHQLRVWHQYIAEQSAEILQGVAEHHNVTVAAVDSGLRRLIDALETRQMPAWKAFKEKTHLAGQKVTAGKLIYTLRAQISQEYGY